MLEIIAYFAVPSFILLVAVYLYIEIQRNEARKQIKKTITLRIAAMKKNFKAEVQRLVNEKTLTVGGQEAIYRIVNNFFVFQAITVENVDYCERLLERIISAMPTVDPDSSNIELAKKQLSSFVSSLPTVAAGHNAEFYQQQLPVLIKQLEDAKIDANGQPVLQPTSGGALYEDEPTMNNSDPV